MVPLIIAALLSQAAAQSTGRGITESVIVGAGGWQASRVEYAPGAVELPGEHLDDLVLVPLDGSLSVEIDSHAVVWTPGVAILITRGAPHRIANTSASPAHFITVRRMTADVGPPPVALQSTAVTIAQSTMSKYIRAVTLRFERGGELRGIAEPGTGATVIVLSTRGNVRVEGGRTAAASGERPAGTVWLFESGTGYTLANLGQQPFEVIRISAPAR